MELQDILRLNNIRRKRKIPESGILAGMTTTKADTTHSIFHSAARFFSGTMLSRITGMLRDMSMAYAFGTQSGIAALLVAFRFAHLLRRLLGEGAMQTALVPHFEELRRDNPLRASSFFRDLTASLTYVLIFFILIIMGGLSALLHWGSLDAGNYEIAQLTVVMMPSLLFICLFGINASLLQCDKSYFAPSAAPIAFNLVWILGVILSSHLPTDQAMIRLSLFVIVACCAQWAITLPQTIASLKALGGPNIWKGNTLFSKDVLLLCKPLTLGIIGVAAAQVNNAMDAVFARWADDEGPAFLWYAIRLQQLPLGLFGVALSGALLPPLSRAIKAGDLTQARHFTDFATLRTLVFIVPITFALLLMGDGCINLVYGHGDFTEISVMGTTLCLWGYTLGLVPMALVLVLAPVYYAKGDYRTPSQASVGSMILNIGLNALLVGVFNFGPASVAIATSASALMNVIWLGITFKKLEIGGPWLPLSLCIKAGQVLLVTLIASCVVIGVDIALWSNNPALDILSGKIPSYEITTLSQILRLGIGGTLFVGIVGMGLRNRLFS